MSSDSHDHPHPHGHEGHQHAENDPACEVAHGDAPVPAAERVLIAVFDTPVARYLLRYAADAGYHTVLVEPDADQANGAAEAAAEVRKDIGSVLDHQTDVVVTDHHRDELGVMLRDAINAQARWVGIMGSPRHPAPHPQALAALGVQPDDIAKVHRPIGLNIGSKTPPEIAISTLAGLIADRNGSPGGFSFG